MWGLGTALLGGEYYSAYQASQGALVVKNPPANAGELREAGLI